MPRVKIDKKKKKNKVVNELAELKQRIAELAASEKEIKRVGEELNVQKKYWEELFESSPDAIAILDNKDRVIKINREFTRLFGYTEKEAVGKHINHLIVPDELKSEAFSLTNRVAKGEKIEVESVRKTKDGTTFDVSILGDPIVLGDNQLAVYGIYRNITKRKKAEKINAFLYEISKAVNVSSDLNSLYPKIHKSLDKIIDSTNFYIALYNKEKDLIRFTYFTDEKDDALEIKNAKNSGSLTAEIINTKQSMLLSQEQLTKKFAHPRKEWGTKPKIWLGVPLRIKNNVIGVIAVQSYTNPNLYSEEDVELLESVSEQIASAIQRKQAEEERQKLEEQLRHSQKMEAIGTLAGGIAHDFNNILAAIMGYTELTLYEIPDGTKACQNLEQILAAADRAKELVKQILAFSRESEKEKRPLLLNKIIKEVLVLLRSTLPATIEIRSEIEENISPIQADSTQIQQVIMNICTNAAYAMRVNGGILKIALKEIDLDPDTINLGRLETGRYQQLTISDTGHGMEAEILERIFEPYFTTKRVREGTGMGLAMVHGIVKNHKGEITVYSEPGRGTIFHIFLPVLSKDMVVWPEIAKKEPVRGGSDRILFVDNELDLAEISKKMLENLGYHVVSRTSSIEALAYFRERPDNFDIVITDMTMPKMTGVQLAEEIHNIRPDIPVILCTGFSESINEENYKSQGINAFVMKPILQKNIAKVIRDVLECK